MTTGSDVRGISSPGQSGSARIVGRVGRDDLDREARARASDLGGSAATASSEPVMLGIADERRARSVDQPRAGRPAGASRDVSHAGSAGSCRSGPPEPFTPDLGRPG